MVALVHHHAAVLEALTLREAIEVQLQQGSKAMGHAHRKEAVSFLLELLGLQPIQAVLLRNLQCSGQTVLL